MFTNSIFTLLIILFILSIIMSISVKRNKDGVPSILGCKTMTVLTGSMAPRINHGVILNLKLWVLEKKEERIALGLVIIMSKFNTTSLHYYRSWSQYVFMVHFKSKQQHQSNFSRNF